MHYHNKQSGNVLIILLMGMCGMMLTGLLLVGYMYMKKSNEPAPVTTASSELYLEYNALLEQMREKREILLQKEEMLAQQSQQIKKLENELDVARKNLEKFQAEVAQNFNLMQDQEQKNLRKLAKMYGLMEPEKAAPIMAALDDESVVQILMMMKERQAARLLGAFSLINPQAKERAAELSVRMRTLTFKTAE